MDPQPLLLTSSGLLATCPLLTGPAAIAKYWSDEAFLDKIGRRLADAMPAATPRPPPPPPQQPPEEVTNLLEAARWGDVEAVEGAFSVHVPGCALLSRGTPD